MRNLTTLLQNGGLTPKERVLFLVHDSVVEDTTGKGILTDADKHALSEGWKPKNSGEAREYNHCNKGWQLEGSMKLDAQTIYLGAQNSLLQASRLVDCVMWKDLKNSSLKSLENFNLWISKYDSVAHSYAFQNLDKDMRGEDGAIDLIIKNSGLVYDRVVHRYAFQSLSKDIQQDILDLYPDAETEIQYLDQEETLAELFDGKEKLTVEAKEKLADLIVDVMHNKYADALKKKGLKSEWWWFNGYFAELPALEIVKKWAAYDGVTYQANDEDVAEELIEKIYEHAETNETSVTELLRATIMRWLNEGLFVKEYTPIWNSNGKNTCNDTSTKLPHKEVLKAWIKAKTEAVATIQKLVDSKQLTIKTKSKEFLGIKEPFQVITGESLYNLDGGFTFAEDYKKQVQHLKLFGRLIKFLRNRDFLNGYASLLAFAEIYKKLSKIYEVDLGYKVDEFINAFKVSIKQLNNELRYISENMEDSIYQGNDITFHATVFVDDMLIQLDKIEPYMGETETHYADEFKKVLVGEF